MSLIQSNPTERNQVAALDSDDEDAVEGEEGEEGDGADWLPDDFVSMANSDNPNVSWGADDASDVDSEEEQWRSIGHGGWRATAAAAAATGAKATGPGGTEENDDDSTVAADSDVGSHNDADVDADHADDISAAPSRFTEYSMTSSILTRSETQARQDDHFEEMYAQVSLAAFGSPWGQG